MNYFAKLHLANGSIIQVNGGRTKFFTPGRDDMTHTEEISLRLVEREKESGFAVFSAVDGSEVSSAPKVISNETLPKKHLSATISLPTNIVRGECLLSSLFLS